MLLVRGTHDLIHKKAQLHRYITEYARTWAHKYGFFDISTPLLEYEGIFSRSLGETSDIIRKEMFVVEQKGEDSHKEAIILRPEGTAPIMRALFMNGLHQTLPQKFFYEGPMFRYDRPQKGRQRQFHQFGIEFLGIKSSWAEIEVISLAFDILKGLGIPNLTLEINTLGDTSSRESYKSALVEYFQNVKEYLSPESQERLLKNPLRILDSKSPQDKKLMEDAPHFRNYLNTSSEHYFETILKELNSLDIPFKVNPHLVRGLDYYSHTVFEITTPDLGAQSTLLAGGRYDALSTLMGNSTEIPAVGWAAGIERLSLLVEEKLTLPTPLQIAFIPLTEEQNQKTFLWSQKVRKEGFTVHFISEGKIAQKFKAATKLRAHYGLILGDEEEKTKTFTLKNFETGDQSKISQDSLISTLKSLNPL
ncbi:MAG: histidine--tRNA ligase [Proteobacteria bacterium]|nr:histidine--tRNA ligase [Pseudomonadota bacterium]